MPAALGGEAAAARDARREREHREAVLRAKIARQIARLDGAISRQLEAVLGSPELRRLESAWRGLRYLVHAAEEAGGDVEIAVLAVGWAEIARDVMNAVEFDRSQMFAKIYSEAIGTAGGAPFGVVLVDHEFAAATHTPTGHRELEVVERLAGIAAAAFCPIILGTSPRMLGLESFSELSGRLQPSPFLTGSPTYLKWRSFRSSPDARFISLTMPRVLMRRSRRHDEPAAPGFGLRLRAEGGALWGSPIYAHGAVLIRCFSDSGFFLDIRGVRVGEGGAGLVPGLPLETFSVDRAGVCTKPVTEAPVDDALERRLAVEGFNVLCDLPHGPYAAFFGDSTLNKPAQYDRDGATMSARFESQLRHVLSASRIAIALYVRTRAKIGSFVEAEVLESELNEWLSGFVLLGHDPTQRERAERPYAEASVLVERGDLPGTYRMTMRLKPLPEYDGLVGALTLTTDRIETS